MRAQIDHGFRIGRAAVLAPALYPEGRAASAQYSKKRPLRGMLLVHGALFDKLEGVKSGRLRYTGGRKPNPTYEEVSSGITGHANRSRSPSIRLSSAIRNCSTSSAHIDPTVKDRSLRRGHQYRSAIFYHGEDQKRLAEASKRRSSSPGASPARSTPRLPQRRRFTPQRSITEVLPEESDPVQILPNGSAVTSV